MLAGTEVPHDQKDSPHITQNEALLFESSSPGKKGYSFPNSMCPPVDADTRRLARAMCATKSKAFPK